MRGMPDSATTFWSWLMDPIAVLEGDLGDWGIFRAVGVLPFLSFSAGFDRWKPDLAGRSIDRPTDRPLPRSR